ncbi:hypothetical protein [Thermomonospora umbrina]|uniref:Flp pilus assembly pilin Flp n=1 Tax=Thermomonospora umbrina TaxID=111806 RepID=A0A3D9T0I9_9ACTN|nr:hypothetical protein [Thermomonospora umbrina]REE98314.1 hypothetical protein DFJ69_3800 [Thermomonospora umbrina]
MNPLNDPAIVYLRAMVELRIHRARTEDRGVGVSAIEWAIITGMLAAIAIAVYAVIRGSIEDSAEKIKTEYK